MHQKQLLPFISNDDLYLHTGKVVAALQSRIHKADTNLYKNVVDPFSAVFGCLIQGISSVQWLELEKARQVQKTLEDYLGYFHQGILSSMPGWEQTTDVVDLMNRKLKLVADVKNKFNTTKGSHKKNIYDDLAAMIGRQGYHDFRGYYVEIIPKKPEPYDRPFTPPDNVTHTRRARNENIRIIDGGSFYELASGHKGALRMLYQTLPEVISEILGKRDVRYIREPVGYIREPDVDYIEGLIATFNRAYGALKEKLV